MSLLRTYLVWKREHPFLLPHCAIYYIDNCVLNAQTPETLRPPILCAVIRNVSALHAGITPIFCVRKLDITFKCLDYRESMSRPRTTK